MVNDINIIRDNVKSEAPLIHSITNPISINQCANAVLAVGARPIMAEHPEEVSEITQVSKALCLNLGNITDVRMKSMLISAKTAKQNSIPIILDLAGVACSQLRRQFAGEIIKVCCPTIIKGNYSEINALYNPLYKSSGVDADLSLAKAQISKIAISLSNQTGSIILASGKTDIVSDAKKLIYINNGSAQLASVTGTGCMLGTLAACYLSACNDIRAAVTACAVLGISGELAETDKGSGSFMIRLMDNLNILKNEYIMKYLKLEEKEIEKF